MPRISAFHGIVITMYFSDHPPPHFHAKYGDHVAAITIDAQELVDGWLPPRALRLVLERAGQHQAELRANWDRARAQRVRPRPRRPARPPLPGDASRTPTHQPAA